MDTNKINHLIILNEIAQEYKEFKKNFKDGMDYHVIKGIEFRKNERFEFFIFNLMDTHVIKNVIFEDCTFNVNDFFHTDGKKSIFVNVTFLNCKFETCIFDFTKYINTTFNECIIENSKFFKDFDANLMNTKLIDCSFYFGNTFNRATWSNVTMEKCEFHNSITHLNGCIKNIKFIECSYSGFIAKFSSIYGTNEIDACTCKFEAIDCVHMNKLPKEFKIKYV